MNKWIQKLKDIQEKFDTDQYQSKHIMLMDVFKVIDDVLHEQQYEELLSEIDPFDFYYYDISLAVACYTNIIKDESINRSNFMKDLRLQLLQIHGEDYTNKLLKGLE